MNFRHILSKSSLKSSSSGKKLIYSEEVLKLQNENESLKQAMETLKIALESRDIAIGKLAREKEKLYVELKSVQRTNRNLHQQLVDERDIHSKEKKYITDEIKRLTKTDAHKSETHNSTCQNETQATHVIREELKAKDEIICNICDKYLKIKCSKALLKKKFAKLQLQCEKTCEDIILLLQENKYSLNNMLSKMLVTFREPVSSKKYLNLLKVNANLHYENIQLKIGLLSQTDLNIYVNKKWSKEDQYSIRTNNFLENKKIVKNLKSRLHQSRRNKTNSLKVLSNFKNVHSIIPYFRRVIYTSCSDPCLCHF